MSKVQITLRVNDEEYSTFIEPHWTLLEVLRERLDLTGTREGCGEGACGSCTVLIDGKPVRACLTLALEAENTDITTIEGLGAHGELDRLQQAFVDHGAVQCGFCTSGMIMAAKGLLIADPHADEPAIRRGISGNICRCTGYAKIVEAISSATNRTDEKR